MIDNYLIHSNKRLVFCAICNKLMLANTNADIQNISYIMQGDIPFYVHGSCEESDWRKNLAEVHGCSEGANLLARRAKILIKQTGEI